MELFRALAVFAEPPTVKGARLAELLELGEQPTVDEYTELFVLQLYPYASVYLGAEGFIGGEARDRVAGFWRALGQTPPAEPDHLSVMLALYARLAEFENGETDPGRREGWRNARMAFLWEHLVSWLFAYLPKLISLCALLRCSLFYERWAYMLLRALKGEAAALREQEQLLPLHLREAGGLVDPREGGADEFLQSVLAPVRSGMILTRSDVERGARELGLGLRRGERKFVLKALLAQEARAVLGWLAAEARAWAARHDRIMEGALLDIDTYWYWKATDAAALLEELKLSAPEVI